MLIPEGDNGYRHNCESQEWSLEAEFRTRAVVCSLWESSYLLIEA